MFYRIKNNNIYDYADYEYANDCLYTNICTMKTFEENKSYYAIKNGELVIVENINEIMAQNRKKQFEEEFFETSLGWIRRKVTMQDGSVKDFLADLLMPIKAGLEMGQQVKIITYSTPDFSTNLTLEYMKSLQQIRFAVPEFIQECLLQTVKDFGLNQGGNYGV